eukprot:gene6950-biopygen4554
MPQSRKKLVPRKARISLLTLTAGGCRRWLYGAHHHVPCPLALYKQGEDSGGRGRAAKRSMPVLVRQTTARGYACAHTPADFLYALLGAPQTGHTQASGRSSKGFPPPSFAASCNAGLTKATNPLPTVTKASLLPTLTTKGAAGAMVAPASHSLSPDGDPAKRASSLQTRSVYMRAHAARPRVRRWRGCGDLDDLVLHRPCDCHHGVVVRDGHPQPGLRWLDFLQNL